MPSESAAGMRGAFAQFRNLIFPVLIVGSVLIIVAPLPPALMDLLLACNVTVSVIILLTTIYVKRPLEFSVFPDPAERLLGSINPWSNGESRTPAGASGAQYPDPRAAIGQLATVGKSATVSC